MGGAYWADISSQESSTVCCSIDSCIPLHEYTPPNTIYALNHFPCLSSTPAPTGRTERSPLWNHLEWFCSGCSSSLVSRPPAPRALSLTPNDPTAPTAATKPSEWSGSVQFPLAPSQDTAAISAAGHRCAIVNSSPSALLAHPCEGLPSLVPPQETTQSIFGYSPKCSQRGGRGPKPGSGVGGWKPPKMGCTLKVCPQNCEWSHVAQATAKFRF